MKLLLPIAAVFVTALNVLPSTIAAEGPLAGRTVVQFDAGPEDSPLEPGATKLGLTSAYAPEIGFGWTHTPLRAFTRPDLSRSRSPLTIDGVTGRKLTFRADVAPGEWFVTLWLEAEQAGETPPQVIIQGRPQETHWQAPPPEIEPDEAPRKSYRVFHGPATVGATGLSIELMSERNGVQLLGLSLIRQADAAKPEQRQLMADLATAGRLRSEASLDDLSKQVEKLLRDDPTDPLPALWRQRLDLLASAEQLAAMRGWEWADEKTGLGMFDRLSQAVMLLDGLLGADGIQAGPLRERALFLRGRLLYWMGKEGGDSSDVAGGRHDLELLYQQHPDDDLVAMYHGKKVDLPDLCDKLKPSPSAPAWSTAQREALCRLRQIVHWWVDRRQADNGEFGGKFGDDVELLRWWSPFALSGDRTALRGWQKLADGVWQSKHIVDGYSPKVRDVEHSAEFVADTAPLMVMFSDDLRYEQRLALSAKHFDELWTGKTAQGHRFFRSAWFSSTQIETDEPKGRDLEYNARAVRAIRYLAWRRHDPELVRMLNEWSTAWLSAALRTDKGKPAGIIPPSVRFADEAINGDGPAWQRAGMYWDYYEWEFSAGSLMLDQLLFTYTLTKNAALLQPMFMALELIRSEQAGLSQATPSELTEGSRAWAADKLIQSSFFWSVVEQWRFSTNDTRWDDLILRHGTAYGRYRLTANEQHLVQGLDKILDTLRYNTPLLTSEAIPTDRVYVPGWTNLKAMLTGDGMPENSSPYYAVSWEKTDGGFTALVSAATSDRLEVQLYSHSPQARRIVMRLWQLDPGEYQMRYDAAGSKPEEWSLRIDEKGKRFEIDLPSQQLLSLRIAPRN